ncbi:MULTISPECIES: exodeoxyribonuclease III [unclassified Cyanobium]|uniref:exodeoxyribonuclease III n=1 Tax=unclassified Cyanobium TaxID=2627006 RepID=UPI0020CF0898|nr:MULTISPECIES: exodeoxyribonuclease III [unclassified Cyanobium]MCP9833620.1 exodeoxyribonuclease III [Cyanobium sp. La Preciosa 7G6]MCP9936385.1 exodeoxyribonuclease III [Cyanobium sp. Aljojuca 7A6]
MRIATWNVNSVRTRLDQVSAWLRTERPEVLCLQETKVADDLFPHTAFEALGYRSVISGQKAYNGVAILSRLPIEDVQVGFAGLLADDPEAVGLGEQKRLISASIEGVRVLNLYVPNGSSLTSEKYPYKLKWLACLRRYLEALEAEGEPLAMVGDFNIALDSRDIHDPDRLSGGIMASDPERQALSTALGDRLSDVFRVFEPERGHWSWWDYRTGAWDRDRGWRIDHIYLSEELLACATGCVIHKDQRGNAQPSDHAPVVVHLAWPPQEAAEGDDHGW